jgi:hypothetical protein
MNCVLFSGNRCPFQTCRPVGERRQGNHVLAGFANHFHLSDGFQHVSPRHTGNFNLANHLHLY